MQTSKRFSRIGVFAFVMAVFVGTVISVTGCSKKSPKRYPYVVLAWNDLGEHCVLTTKYGGILPPFNTMWAQVIRRDEPPEIVTDSIRVTYTFPNFEHPEKQVPDFWNYSEKIWGKPVEPGKGLTGRGTSGEMELKGEAFVAEGIPLVPFEDDGTFNPYPVAHIKVLDKKTGNVLGETQAVAPLSNESGCGLCHGGMAKNGSKFLTDETWLNILATHDKLSKTNLKKEALAGSPVACASCHADPAVGAKGKKGLLSLSAAIMGWHAQFIQDEGTPNTCGICHPSAVGKSVSNPTGALRVKTALHPDKWTEITPTYKTSCYRGVMAGHGVSCQHCHGTLPQLGSSLLAVHPDNPASKKIMAALRPKMEGKKPVAKLPWLQEPDCLACHVQFKKAKATASAYGHWVAGFNHLYRNSKTFDVYCEACHNSTHSLWGTITPVSKTAFDADNYQPMKYQGFAGPIGANGHCEVCHAKKPVGTMHKNMLQKYYGAPHSKYENIDFSMSF